MRRGFARRTRRRSVLFCVEAVNVLATPVVPEIRFG
jgi:hypothetical protein